jgi:hypothetical protein
MLCSYLGAFVVYGDYMERFDLYIKSGVDLHYDLDLCSRAYVFMQVIAPFKYEYHLAIL